MTSVPPPGTVYNGISGLATENFHLLNSTRFVNFVETSAKMATPELLKSFTILSRKVDALIQERDSLLVKVKELEDHNKTLLEQKQLVSKQLENVNKEKEFLILSHRLAASPEALIESRNIISRLIRTIDSCIRELTDEEV